MTNVIVVDRDPALAKLLDELPSGDPDDHKVVVWVNQCDEIGLIPLNKHCHLSLGPWHGPSTHWTQIKFFYQYLNNSGSAYIGSCNTKIVRAGDLFMLDVIVGTI